MNKTLLIASIIICLLFWNGNCKIVELHYSINIENNSPHDISFYVAGLGMEHLYPDTTLQTDSVPMQIIPSGKTRSWSNTIGWDNLFKQLPKDTLSIYLFSSDTLTKYRWNIIRKEYKILKRYDLSLSDLKKSNFGIHYSQ